MKSELELYEEFSKIMGLHECPNNEPYTLYEEGIKILPCVTSNTTRMMCLVWENYNVYELFYRDSNSVYSRFLDKEDFNKYISWEYKEEKDGEIYIEILTSDNEYITEKLTRMMNCTNHFMRQKYIYDLKNKPVKSDYEKALLCKYHKKFKRFDGEYFGIILKLCPEYIGSLYFDRQNLSPEEKWAVECIINQEHKDILMAYYKSDLCRL